MKTEDPRQFTRGAPAAGQRSAAGFALADLVAGLGCVALLTAGVVLVGSSTNCGTDSRTDSGTFEVDPLGRTLAQRKNLQDGAENYAQEHNGFYPGQDDETRYASHTGSQILAACLFGYDVTAADPEPTGKYAAYKEKCLATLNGRKNVLSDMFPKGKAMAFCYYAFRTGKFLHEDNAPHTKGREAAKFAELIIDERFGENTPYNQGRFLLLAPGTDRKYFSKDDIKNWTPWRERR